jgi:high affinity Mn2+ porin
MGILIGDGRMNYRPEKVIEAYYAYSPITSATLTFDYQLFVDPAYNADRGPVSIFALRAHGAF